MSATYDFTETIAWLDALPVLVEAAAERGLQSGVDELREDAQATALYNDDTGAMRAATVAYVAGTAEGDAAVSEGVAKATAKNPGRVALEEVAGRPRTSMVILTSFVSYLGDLVTNSGGARDWLGEAMPPHAARLQDRALGEIGGLFDAL